jgi:hypothetical protein
MVKTYRFTCRGCNARLPVEEESKLRRGYCDLCYGISQNGEICANCGEPAYRHRAIRLRRSVRFDCRAASGTFVHSGQQEPETP